MVSCRCTMQVKEAQGTINRQLGDRSGSCGGQVVGKGLPGAGLALALQAACILLQRRLKLPGARERAGCAQQLQPAEVDIWSACRECGGARNNSQAGYSTWMCLERLVPVPAIRADVAVWEVSLPCSGS